MKHAKEVEEQMQRPRKVILGVDTKLDFKDFKEGIGSPNTSSLLSVNRENHLKLLKSANR